MNYITGTTIRTLREKQSYTQKQLADKLGVSDKTVSKWETSKGLPDITLIEPLAEELKVSVAELLSGQCVTNQNKSANLRRSCFYVCPICGNVIHSLGEGAFSCCGISLPRLEAEEAEDLLVFSLETIDNEYFLSMKHPMDKQHFISFFAYVTGEHLQLVKLYPEQSPEARFRICGRGTFYAYCNRHGLFQLRR